MKKSLRYLILIPIIYLIAIFIKNYWDTLDVNADLLKIKVINVEYGDFGEWYDDAIYFDTRLSVSDKSIGYIYYNSDLLKNNAPKKIKKGDEYVVYLLTHEAHSWADVLMFGARYDYRIFKFAEGQKEDFDIDNVYDREKLEQPGTLETAMGIIISVLLVLIWFISIYFIQKYVYNHPKQKDGVYHFNKPNWLEFISALSYGIFALLSGAAAITFIQFGSWFYAVIFILISLYNLINLLKEYMQRNDEIQISNRVICIKDGKTTHEFNHDEVEKIDITTRKTRFGSSEIQKISITQKNQHKFSYDLEENNLIQFSSSLLTTLKLHFGNVIMFEE